MQIRDVKPPATDANYDDDLLLDIRHGVLFTLIRGRNAWHSTWVKHYFKNAALYSSLQSARFGAERLRGRGNVFYIHETRALLLRGEKRGIVVCDSHSPVPFEDYTGDQQRVRADQHERWVDGLYPGVSLWDAFTTFATESEFWSRRTRGAFSTKSGEVPLGFEFAEQEGPLLSWESYAQGTHNSLGWLKTGNGTNRSPDSLDRISAYWNSRLDDVRSGIERSEVCTSADLARYRETTIAALPRSVWRVERSRARIRARLLIAEAEDKANVAMKAYFEAEVKVEKAEEEYEDAKYDFLKPAETAAGIRQQRAAAEAAGDRLAVAQALFEQAEEAHRKADEALRALRSELRESGSWP